MKQLKEQLKNKTYSKYYLFTGEEKYLMDIYLKRFTESIFEGQDKMMNLDFFDQENKDIDKVEASLETLPFFATTRVVVLENLDLFNAKNKKINERLVEQLKKMTDATICFIVEDKIDKRNKLYKWIKEQGTVSEFDFLGEKELISFVGRELGKAEIKISTYDAKYFIETVGYELRMITKEVSKLIDYVGGNEIATKNDIDLICTKHLEAKIFELVDAVGNKNREKALFLYQDMIALKEPTTRILFMISRQITLIYQAKLLKQKRLSLSQMGKELKVPEFVVKKIIYQGEQFSFDNIKKTIKELVELEHDFKSGKMNLETGIELMILKLAR